MFIWLSLFASLFSIWLPPWHKGEKVFIYLGSLVQLYCGEGGTLQTNITGVYVECSQCLGHIGFASAPCMCAFPVNTAQAPGCSAGELSKVSLGLHALPRSKPLRFRFSVTPQRDRLGWACVLCPSQVWTAQATRCSVSGLSQLCGASYQLPGPSLLVSWVRHESAVSNVPCGSSGELISDCNPHGGCQPSRIAARLC